LSTVFLQKSAARATGREASQPAVDRQSRAVWRAATTSGGWLAAFGGGLRHSAAGCNVWRRQAAVKCGQVKRLAHFALNFFLKQRQACAILALQRRQVR